MLLKRTVTFAQEFETGGACRDWSYLALSLTYGTSGTFVELEPLLTFGSAGTLWCTFSSCGKSQFGCAFQVAYLSALLFVGACF